MGYTHYWSLKRDIAPLTWAQICLDTTAICVVSSVPIKRDPLLYPEGIITIDGVEDDEGPEAFRFEQHIRPEQFDQKYNRHFDYCKTDRRPYDALVGAILITAKYWLGDNILISSDGLWREWEQGAYKDTNSPVSLYRQATGRTPENILTNSVLLD